MEKGWRRQFLWAPVEREGMKRRGVGAEDGSGVLGTNVLELLRMIVEERDWWILDGLWRSC